MIRFIALIAVAALASCGVDGAPIKPTVSAGINVGSGGVKTGVNLGQVRVHCLSIGTCFDAVTVANDLFGPRHLGRYPSDVLLYSVVRPKRFRPNGYG